MTPMEMRVSMVAARWRRLVHAARWNGSAPHTTTGDARVRASHCQLVNCSGGIIDSSSTGSPSRALTMSRSRNDLVGSVISADSGAAAGTVAV